MQRKKIESVFPVDSEELKRLSLEDSGIVLKENVPHRVRILHCKLPVNSIGFRNAVDKELHKRILKFNHE